MSTSVEYQHSSYSDNIADWVLLRDCYKGSRFVKEKGQTYLPVPAGKDAESYLSYKERGIYYNVVKRTVNGVIGSLYRKPPVMEYPESMSFLEDDADGYGNSLDHFSRKISEETILQGRVGIMIDHPVLDGSITLAQQREMDIHPFFVAYETEEIINWRHEVVNGKNKLVLVVLHEKIFEYGEDQFEPEALTQYRVLELIDGIYTVTIYREVGGTSPHTGKVGRSTRNYEIHDRFVPTDVNGQPFDTIQFVLIGSVDLTGDIDPSPMLDIANLSIAHYRNSCDYEEALYLVGQPTPYITGLTEQYIEKYSGTLVIGSRAAWLLPENSDAGLLEMTRDLRVLSDAMRDKEQQMVGVGARLFQVQGATSAEKPEAIKLRQVNESGTLASISGNISAGIKKAMRMLGTWVGDEDPKIGFALNDNFFAARLSAQEILATVHAWQKGALSTRELFENFVEGDWIDPDKTYDEHEKDLETQDPVFELSAEAGQLKVSGAASAAGTGGRLPDVNPQPSAEGAPQAAPAPGESG